MARYDYQPRFGPENYSIVLSLEEKFDAERSTIWMQNNWHHSLSWSIGYIVAIFAGQKLMASREPFQLDAILFLWNASLAIFSLLGFIRMSPEWLWSLKDNSFTYSVCIASYCQGVSAFWSELFAMSKVVELVDTGFIVLRKRPLIFLHWYHHITVLMYTWHAYKDHTASGRWFIWMNYGVHAVMYSYYALSTLKFRPAKQVAMLVTILQISQMIMGVIIGIHVYNIKNSGQYCQQTYENLGLCFGIYFTYFLLFCNFFYHAYVKKNVRNVVIKSLKMDNIELSDEPKKDLNANKVIDEKSATNTVKRRARKAE